MTIYTRKRTNELIKIGYNIYKAFTLKELRRRQNIVEIQIRQAYAQQNDTALEKLTITDQALILAVQQISFGDVVIK